MYYLQKGRMIYFANLVLICDLLKQKYNDLEGLRNLYLGIFITPFHEFTVKLFLCPAEIVQCNPPKIVSRVLSCYSF